MIDFKVNKNKVVPNLVEYFKIFISVLIANYLLLPIVFKLFPIITKIDGLLQLVVTVFIIAYIKDLFDLKIFGRDFL